MEVMPKRYPSLFSAVIHRQIYGASARRDLSMLRTLIEKDGVYQKVWEKSSKSAIIYEGSVFLDAYRTCYDLSGLPGEPRVVYQLPKLPLEGKIESLLVFESPLDQRTFLQAKDTSCGNGSYSLGLTKDNHLKLFEIRTGMTLEMVYLSSRSKFKYLAWETDLERILIKTTLSTNRDSAHGMLRVPRTTQSEQVLLYLAVLCVCPLRFLCNLPISKYVFGYDVCNASVRNGLLIVMHSKGKMRFYSFDDILERNSISLNLGDHLDHGNKHCLPEMDEFTSGVVGARPVGLPVNVHLTEKPCVLFEVDSYNHDLSLGGFPWHYIITNKNLVFQVRSLKDGSLVENGSLESKTLSIEADKAFFHTDLSGRILHIEPTMLHCLKMTILSSSKNGGTEPSLSEEYVLDYGKLKETSTSSCITKSGRHVKQLHDYHDDNVGCEIIQDVDYDDELDILVVLYRDLAVKDAGIVGFYDNQTGQTLRELRVNGMTEEGEHSVAIDRNVLVMISKNKAKFTCVVYALIPGLL